MDCSTLLFYIFISYKFLPAQITSLYYKVSSPPTAGTDDRSSLPKMSGGGIFQTELITSPEKVPAPQISDTDDEDDIEQQMLNAQKPYGATSKENISSPRELTKDMKTISSQYYMLYCFLCFCN